MRSHHSTRSPHDRNPLSDPKELSRFRSRSMPASKDLDTPLRSRWFMFRTRWSEKRILGLIAALVGLVAGILILIAATAGQGVSLLTAIVGLGVLYGSYLIYRGKTIRLFGWGKARLGAWINLIIGVATLLLHGGVGGTESILAIVSGVLGLLAA